MQPTQAYTYQRVGRAAQDVSLEILWKWQRATIAIQECVCAGRQPNLACDWILHPYLGLWSIYKKTLCHWQRWWMHPLCAHYQGRYFHTQLGRLSPSIFSRHSDPWRQVCSCIRGNWSPRSVDMGTESHNECWWQAWPPQVRQSKDWFNADQA